MTLQDFNKLYRYRSDPDGIDQWRIPSYDESGLLQDDCDGFSLSVLYYVIARESWLRFWCLLVFGSAKIYYVTNEGAGHAVLRYKGKYIDNWTRRWVSKAHMESLGHTFHWSRSYYFWQVALKMLLTKLRTL